MDILVPYPGYVHDLEPQLLSISLAAALVGLSPRTFRRQYLQTGRLSIQKDVLWGRPYIRRRALEEVIGREFSPAEIRAAESRKLAPRRAYQRDYARRQNRKGNH